MGPKESLALARAASTVVIARGKKVLTYKMADAPEDDELLKLMLGRSETLRAPTLRQGKTLLVGFNATAYDSLLG